MRYILSFLLCLTACASAGGDRYQRTEWHPRWADHDKDCQNTRAEILISRSLIPVTYTNKKKCSVEAGKWDDYYFPQALYLAKEVDIDHLVPLYEAYQSGGQNWSKQQKLIFANDPENLVITSKRTNRQKGANTLKGWLPLHHKHACRYYKQWMYIKKKYHLHISQDEISSLDLTKCI